MTDQLTPPLVARVRAGLPRVFRLLGLDGPSASHTERIVSIIGGIVAIYALIWLERGLLGQSGAAMLVSSMGASAVLLFAVPHGALSQPWAVVAGHGVSALVGVTCFKLVPDPMLASAMAVGLAVGAMYYLRAIHPPGGATALTAVIGGPAVTSLGYQFVVTPVLINAIAMVVLAVAINAAFPWRRYPAAWGRSAAKLGVTSRELDAGNFTHADFTTALSRMGTFVDISERDFLQLRDLMVEAAAARRPKAEDIKLGHYYSNGATGAEWSVRRIVDEQAGKLDGNVIWRAVAGRDGNVQAMSGRREFAQWASYEVVQRGADWVRFERG
jgi:CBS domain-containing membrane protein